MQIIANFSYAGTSKYVSHAVENGSTLCGMSVDDLFARRGQEWDEVFEEYHLSITHKHSVGDVGCLKCVRLLTQRALDKGYAPAKTKLAKLEDLLAKEADTTPAPCE